MVAGGEMESSGQGRSRRGSTATAAMEDSGGLHGDGDRRLERAGDGSDAEDERAASPPERCEALAAAISGVLGGTLREHDARAAATARSQDEVAAAIDCLNGGV
jgi:hypothetical protein